jgi:glycosyltransferase involved in cell wall biosynthesis
VKNNRVSIIVPCYNESEYISGCIDSILKSNLKELIIEIIIVDGNSSDNTKKIIQEYSLSHNFIQLLDNPKRVIPSAMNLGIKAAKYDIIMKMDAHSQYEKNYIRECVNNLMIHKVDNIGGSVIHVPREDTYLGKAICVTLSSPFGVGNSYFRIGSNEPRLVDTVPFGCFKKETLEKINYYDENIHRSEDIVLNHKIKKCGGKILLLPNLKIYYKTRSKYFEFVKHTYDNGKWSILPIFLTKGFPFSGRHLIPLFFICYLVSILLFQNYAVSKLYNYPFYFYLITNALFSLFLSIKNKSIAQFIFLPITYFSLHIAYGIGSVAAILSRPFK